MNGYIKIQRSIIEHGIFADAEYFRAWIYILCNAGFKDKTSLTKYGVDRLPAGSFVTSIGKFGAVFGWSWRRAERFLNLLERESMIATKRTNKNTVITVVNWGVYQLREGKKCRADDIANDRADDIADGIADDIQLNNVKNVKKGNKKNRALAPLGAAPKNDERRDTDNPAPEGWTDDLEETYRNDRKKGDQTREGWYQDYLVFCAECDEQEKERNGGDG